jgi:arylsulfatase A-like enzyme
MVGDAVPVRAGVSLGSGGVCPRAEPLRADHLGAWGDPRGLTPHLDAFAATAVRFSQAHSAAPWTKPAMGSVMTSLLPKDHGVRQWENQFAPDQVTLATTLQDAGYTTEAIVAHNAFAAAQNGFDLGFDSFVETWRLQPEPGSPDEIETSTYLTDRALEALTRLEEAEQPFFLWVHYFLRRGDRVDRHPPGPPPGPRRPLPRAHGGDRGRSRRRAVGPRPARAHPDPVRRAAPRAAPDPRPRRRAAWHGRSSTRWSAGRTCAG